MDKSIHEFIAYRKRQIQLQLQSMAYELAVIERLEEELSSGDGDVHSDNNEDDTQVTEEDIIEIMKAGKGPWNKKKLLLSLCERNPDLRGLTRPVLGDQINAIMLKSTRFKTVRPGYLELADES